MKKGKKKGEGKLAKKQNEAGKINFMSFPLFPSQTSQRKGARVEGLTFASGAMAANSV